MSVLLFTLCACGDDDGPSADGGRADGGGEDGGGEEIDCTGMADGASCGEGAICFADVCVPSRCGDGYVDSASGEECEDENDVPGDGCEPSCRFTCTEDSDCDDMFPCNGAETCNVAMHRCQAGTPDDGAACTQEDESEGVCSGGLCASPGCGNGVVDEGEECDDGQNGDNADGCRDDCTYTCETDDECLDADACNGAETCDVGSNTCLAATALDCDDGDPCTADSCDESEGCVNAPIDMDMDGYSPGSCTTTGVMGGDCDDTNSTVYPTAPETCDSIDNDCNGMVDDGTVDITCYRDADGDGFGNMSSSMTACSCPMGYVPSHPSGFDCKDTGTYASEVYPANPNWYTGSYCPTRLCAIGTESYDWNCDGDETQRWTNVSSGCSRVCLGRGCYCFGTGWIDSVPACGGSGTFRTCSLSRDGSSCVGTLESDKPQECH